MRVIDGIIKKKKKKKIIIDGKWGGDKQPFTLIWPPRCPLVWDISSGYAVERCMALHGTKMIKKNIPEIQNNSGELSA
jgi:hypothetical protein